MTRDAALREMVRQLDALPVDAMELAGGLVEDILLRWAQVDDHDPDWRNPGGGGNIDSRKVDFLEQFGGITWAQRGTAPLVGVNASLGIKLAWQGVHAMMTARLLAQGPLEAVIGESRYDFAADRLILSDGLTTILNRAQAAALPLPAAQAQTFWATLGDVLVTLRESFGATVAQINSAVTAKAGFNLFLGTKTLTEADGVLYSFGEEAPTLLVEGVRVGETGWRNIMKTVNELATAARLHRSTISRAIAQKKITAIKYGRCIRIEEEVFENFLRFGTATRAENDT